MGKILIMESMTKQETKGVFTSHWRPLPEGNTVVESLAGCWAHGAAGGHLVFGGVPVGLAGIQTCTTQRVQGAFVPFGVGQRCRVSGRGCARSNNSAGHGAWSLWCWGWYQSPTFFAFGKSSHRLNLCGSLGPSSCGGPAHATDGGGIDLHEMCCFKICAWGQSCAQPCRVCRDSDIANHEDEAEYM